MKRFLVLFTVVVFAAGCNKSEKEPYSDEQGNIYNPGGDVVFGSILLDLKPYLLHNNQKKYVANPQLSNVMLMVNDMDFGEDHSLLVDTALVEKEIVDNTFVTAEEIKYPVVVWYNTDTKPLNTAGDFSDLLNDYAVLEPGLYHCRVVSFDIVLADNSVQTVNTNISKLIDIKPGLRNIYLGEFETKIREVR